MDKAQAVHSFWAGFGLPAYDENSVPDNATMPYITYSVGTGALGDLVVLQGSLWYRSPSWEAISKKADQIAEAVGGQGHLIIPLDQGRLYLTQGVPFAQRMADEADSMIRRIYININAEFLTAY